MTHIVLVFGPLPPLRATDVRWMSPEIHLGVLVHLEDEQAPLADKARRLCALTTTASSNRVIQIVAAAFGVDCPPRIPRFPDLPDLHVSCARCGATRRRP